jgi:cytochrome b561
MFCAIKSEGLPMARRPNFGQADAGRYTPTAIGLHWIIAFWVIVVGTLGLLHDSWPKNSQAFWINLHALLGLAVLALLIARIWWRRTRTPPPLPPEIGAFTIRLSHAVHLLLYALLIVIPILGIVTFVWHGRVFDFGLFKVDFGVTRDKNIVHPTEEYHGDLAYALFGLASVHALAAFGHHFIKRDGVLMRMWPGARK